MRFDPQDPVSKHPAYQTSHVLVEARGATLHFESGPPAIYYRKVDSLDGEYDVSATFHQTASNGHEAYGIFFGGSQLKTPNQRYLYFVIRLQRGAYLVNYRTSDQPPTKIVQWTLHPSVEEEGGRLGAASNVLAIRVRRHSIVFLVNGTPVDSLDQPRLHGVSTDGLVGLRINHNITVDIENFVIARLRKQQATKESRPKLTK